jgi:hypothetical protein
MTAKKLSVQRKAAKAERLLRRSLERRGLTFQPLVARSEIVAFLRRAEERGEDVPTIVAAMWVGLATRLVAAVSAISVGALRTSGLVDYEAGDVVMPTEAGRAAWREPETPPTTSELHASVLAALPDDDQDFDVESEPAGDSAAAS